MAGEKSEKKRSRGEWPLLHCTAVADDVLAVQESSDEAEVVVQIPSKASSSKPTPLKPVLAAPKAVANMDELLYGSKVSAHWEMRRTAMQQAIEKTIFEFQPTNMPDQVQWRSYGRWLHEANRLSMLADEGHLLNAVKKAADEIKADTAEIKFFIYAKLEDEQDEQNEQDDDGVLEGAHAVAVDALEDS